MAPDFTVRLTEWLLLQDQEHSIQQFEVFCEVVQLKRPLLACSAPCVKHSSTYIVENDQLIGPAALGVADGMEETMVVESRNQLLNKEHQQYPTNSSEVEVVDLEDGIQLERFPTAHQLPPTKDYEVV